MARTTIMDSRDYDPQDEYKSPFNFDCGVNRNYLFLSPHLSNTPPDSPTRLSTDLLKPESVPEGEDAAATLKDTLSDEEQEILRKELEKDRKRVLGPDWPGGEAGEVATWMGYRKTSETLSNAGQRASAAISTVGSVITKKLEDVKNSPTFKSFEEKVESLKSKVGGPKQSTGDFEEVLNSAANASASATEDLTEKDEENH
ncbi:hypothetical protein AB205_0140860 [Aquarana catesbeiana]|uniref:Tumor protein D52 n=1 Tax=Aquarana catesbeiana TaxID=8400 RepID=A0A2G9S4B5_AQUCT|nr:hypothetical protein AB205_0140860 [Aquarana catesbeiana]